MKTVQSGAPPAAPSHSSGEKFRILRDAEASDSQWDSFLEANPLGQFQQSSKWGAVKSQEGWFPFRVKICSEIGIEAGFQLLWKHGRFGRIGYISKGPVLRTEDPAMVQLALQHLTDAARQLRLRALIVQPPDFSRIGSSDLLSRGFSDAPVPSVIDATLLLDTSSEITAIENAMSGRLRAEGRQAVKRGVRIVRGEIADIPLFFDLMCVTCKRQGATPNPSRADLVEALLQSFPSNAHLWMALWNDKKVAGLLTVGFGDRLTFWKKGWSSEGKEAHPNVLLHLEVIRWAKKSGFKSIDFVGVDREIAETLLNGQNLTDAHLRSRHLFNLRLGAKPHLLPRAHVFIPQPILRMAFSVLQKTTKGRHFLRKLGKAA